MGRRQAGLEHDLVGAHHRAGTQFGDGFEDGGLADDELFLVVFVEGFAAGERGDGVEDNLCEWVRCECG